MIKKIKELKAMAEFYELSFIDMFVKYILNPREYDHMKLEMIKYKLVTASKWEV